MTNPLLTKSVLPHFSTITPQDVSPAINTVLDSYRQTIETILKENSTFSWNNLCQPLEEANNKLSRAWSPVGHLHAVKTVMNYDKFMITVYLCYQNLVPGWGNTPAFTKLISH